jgi:hypothetical protein
MIATSSAIPPPAGMSRTPVADFVKLSLTNRPVRGHSRPFSGQHQDFPELTVRWPTLGRPVPAKPRKAQFPTLPLLWRLGLIRLHGLKRLLSGRSGHPSPAGLEDDRGGAPIATQHASKLPGTKAVVQRPRSGHFYELAAVTSSRAAGASAPLHRVELAARFHLSWPDGPRRPVRPLGLHCCLPSVSPS